MWGGGGGAGVNVGRRFTRHEPASAAVPHPIFGRNLSLEDCVKLTELPSWLSSERRAPWCLTAVGASLLTLHGAVWEAPAWLGAGGSGRKL